MDVEPIVRQDAAEEVFRQLLDDPAKVEAMGRGWMAAHSGELGSSNPHTGDLGLKWAEGWRRQRMGMPRPDVGRIGAAEL